MYRRANRGKYLVTALVDRGTYQAYEIAEHRGFLDSSAVRATAGAVAAAAAALGIVLGARASRSHQLGTLPRSLAAQARCQAGQGDRHGERAL